MSEPTATGCIPSVGQDFLDEDDLWLASCPCGWVHSVRLPHDLAVVAAREHGQTTRSTAICTDCRQRFDLSDLVYRPAWGGHFCEECSSTKNGRGGGDKGDPPWGPDAAEYGSSAEVTPE